MLAWPWVILPNSAEGRYAGVEAESMAWIVRFVVAAAAVVAQWFVARLFLRFGALQALLSLAVFLGVTFPLVLVPWPRERH